MKLTNNSRKLINFFSQQDCLNPQKFNKKTISIFKKLFNEISKSVSYINKLKEQMGNTFYKLKINHITNINQIPKPTTFPANGFPDVIRKQIDDHSLSSLIYKFNLFNRNIQIIFLIEDSNPELLIDTYNTYVDYMLVWLYIVDQYASRNCASELKIYVYHTSLNKILPQTNIQVLDETNVNTAFTRTCPKNSEIIIFRKEEWFKVFMHETFHNFGLDFSDMNNSLCHSKILKLFPVNSEVNLFEAYTEFWARIMNILFCSYINMKNKDNISEFLINVNFLMNVEIIYSFFQMVKILNFMDLSYKNLYAKDGYSESIRKTMYKENTSVLSYYVITLILINNFQDFLSWCQTNNTSLLQFKKTTSSQEKLCEFISKRYKSNRLLDGIDCTEYLLINMKNNVKGRKNIGYLLTNLRMTLCELG